MSTLLCTISSSVSLTTGLSQHLLVTGMQQCEVVDTAIDSVSRLPGTSGIVKFLTEPGTLSSHCGFWSHRLGDSLCILRWGSLLSIPFLILLLGQGKQTQGEGLLDILDTGETLASEDMIGLQLQKVCKQVFSSLRTEGTIHEHLPSHME